MVTRARVRTRYVCHQCGAGFPKWSGQCPDCKTWNSLEEQLDPGAGKGASTSATGVIHRFDEIGEETTIRRSTGSRELDRVLGGGLAPASVILLGGDPGIGKSTLLLQCVGILGSSEEVLYVTGEESPQQVAARARRIGLDAPTAGLMAENRSETICAAIEREKPALVVIDSIQTMVSQQIDSAPGGVSQVRETAQMFVNTAKRLGCTIVLVGHVTKDGALAGPRVLEHMVDTVLYFEGDRSTRFRLLRAVKNRYGAVNEIGVFAMTEGGLKDVSNPSAMLLSGRDESLPGSVVVAGREATRPLLLEVQALVDSGSASQPRRLAVGVDGNRLNIMLAVMHRHCGVAVSDQDVFVNVVGGVRVSDTAADLAVCAAIHSSLTNHPVSTDTVVFGEVGLSGEVRPVQGGADRLREAAKQGFRRALVPEKNCSRQMPGELEVTPVTKVAELLEVL